MKQQLTIATCIFVLTAAATAQEMRSEVSAQATGVFTTHSIGRGIKEYTTNSGGFLADYRYHFKRWIALDATYGYTRNSQDFLSLVGVTGIAAGVHQLTGVASIFLPAPSWLRISPYILSGGGGLIFEPVKNGTASMGTRSQAVGVFSYGGGLDVPWQRHFSIRAEYRGLLYKAPDFGLSYRNSNALTHTAEPSAGIVFRF